MAPSLEVLYEETASTTALPLKAAPSPVHTYIPGRTIVEGHDTYDHEDLKPFFPDKHWPALEEVPTMTKPILATPPSKISSQKQPTSSTTTPKPAPKSTAWTSRPSPTQPKNDLALLIATRGVVFFRNQKNFNIDDQRKLGQYYGTLHKHTTTCVPKRGDLDDVHVVYTDEKSKDQRAIFPTFLWHSDVTYEAQPPSYTSLKVISGPPRGGGGDTLWSSNYAAYDATSTPMQKYLELLTALHSSHMQAEGSRALGRPVRREPVVMEHPLIRSHLVTG
jgi:sulfonate dioxygenase